MTCLVMFMVPLGVWVKPQPTLPRGVRVKVAVAVGRLAEPPVPQLTAVRSNGDEPPVSVTVYVPALTTNAVVAEPELVLSVKEAGGPPAPSEVPKVKLPLPPTVFLLTVIDPLPTFVNTVSSTKWVGSFSRRKCQGPVLAVLNGGHGDGVASELPCWFQGPPAAVVFGGGLPKLTARRGRQP